MSALPDLSHIGRQARALRWFAREALLLIENRPCPACSARRLLLDDVDETAAIDGALIDALLAADLNLSIAAMTDGIARAAGIVWTATPHKRPCPLASPQRGGTRRDRPATMLNGAEAARALKISRQRVCQLVKAGTLPVIWDDGRWYVTQETVDARLASPAWRPRADACIVCNAAWVSAERRGKNARYCSRRCRQVAGARRLLGLPVADDPGDGRQRPAAGEGA